MPINEYGMNSDYVNYFSLDDYVNRIKLLPGLLDHLDSTSHDFDLYMKKLFNYSEEYIVNYWIYLLYEELKSNQWIENQRFNEGSLAKRDIFFGVALKLKMYINL